MHIIVCSHLFSIVDQQLLIFFFILVLKLQSAFYYSALVCLLHVILMRFLVELGFFAFSPDKKKMKKGRNSTWVFVYTNARARQILRSNIQASKRMYVYVWANDTKSAYKIQFIETHWNDANACHYEIYKHSHYQSSALNARKRFL